MKTFLRGALMLTALLSWSTDHAGAATQSVLGKKFQVKNPDAGDSTKRKVIALARERASSATIVGNPLTDGAVVQVIANGATDSDHTFNLAKEGWSAIGTVGFKYSSRIPGGAVRSALLKRTPSGMFMIKLVVQGRGGPIVVVPPNPGDDGGFILKLTGGDSYCVAFGGAAGGTETADDSHMWAVRNPSASACPTPAGAPPTTTSSSSTTSTTSPFPTTSTSSTTTSSTSSSTVPGATTSITSTSSTVATTSSTLPPFPFNDCGGSPFPTCNGTGCPAGFACAIVFAEPTSADGGCACVPVGPGEAACNGVPPASCPANPVCPPGSSCFANPSFGGGCGCGQCAQPFCP